MLVSSTLCLMSLVSMALIELEIDVEPPMPPIMAAFADEIQPVEEPIPMDMPLPDPGEQQIMEELQPVEAPTEEPPSADEPLPEEPEPEDPAEPEPEAEPEMSDDEVVAEPEMESMPDESVPEKPKSDAN